jgi:hypothetical protein
MLESSQVPLRKRQELASEIEAKIHNMWHVSPLELQQGEPIPLPNGRAAATRARHHNILGAARASKSNTQSHTEHGERSNREREGGGEAGGGGLLPDVVLPVGRGGGGRAAGGRHGGEPLREVAVEELPVREEHPRDGQDAEAVRGQGLAQRRRGDRRDRHGRRQRDEAAPQQLVPPHATRSLARQLLLLLE